MSQSKPLRIVKRGSAAGCRWYSVKYWSQTQGRYVFADVRLSYHDRVSRRLHGMVDHRPYRLVWKAFLGGERRLCFRTLREARRYMTENFKF